MARKSKLRPKNRKPQERWWEALDIDRAVLRRLGITPEQLKRPGGEMLLCDRGGELARRTYRMK